MNCVHFQLAMLAYNLNCWLLLFHREEQAKVEDLRHITLVRYSDHYAEKGAMGRLMDRLRAIVPSGSPFAPVVATALRL
jgi:hypothetical protein